MVPWVAPGGRQPGSSRPSVNTSTTCRSRLCVPRPHPNPQLYLFVSSCMREKMQKERAASSRESSRSEGGDRVFTRPCVRVYRNGLLVSANRAVMKHLYPSFLPVRTSMRTFARTHSIFVRRLRAQTLINLFSIDMHQTSDVQVNGKLFASAGFLEMHSHMQLFSHSLSTRMCLTTIQQTEAMVQSLSMQLQRFTQNKRSSGGDADDDATSALQQQVRNKSIARPWPDHGQIRISPLFKGARVHIILHNHSSPTSLRLVRDHGQIWAHPRLIVM